MTNFNFTIDSDTSPFNFVELGPNQTINFTTVTGADSDYVEERISAAQENKVDSEFVLNLIADSDWIVRQITSASDSDRLELRAEIALNRVDSEFLESRIITATQNIVDSDFVLNLIADSDWVDRQIKAASDSDKALLRAEIALNRIDSDWVNRQLPSNVLDSDDVQELIDVNRVDSDWICRKIALASDSDRQYLEQKLMDSEEVIRLIDSDYINDKVITFAVIDSDATPTISDFAGAVFYGEYS